MRRETVVAAARELIGTPYLHQGRTPGEQGGLDCIGVPVVLARLLGIKPLSWDVNGYRRVPDGHTLMRRIRQELADEVGPDEMAPGDVAVFDWGQFPHHVGMLADYRHGGLSLIHADNVMRKVIEQRLVLKPPIRFVAAFRFPGVI